MCSVTGVKKKFFFFFWFKEEEKKEKRTGIRGHGGWGMGWDGMGWGWGGRKREVGIICWGVWVLAPRMRLLHFPRNPKDLGRANGNLWVGQAPYCLDEPSEHSGNATGSPSYNNPVTALHVTCLAPDFHLAITQSLRSASRSGGGKDTEHPPALRLWRHILPTNPPGSVSPIPPGESSTVNSRNGIKTNVRFTVWPAICSFHRPPAVRFRIYP
jgi:hypothetical protein